MRLQRLAPRPPFSLRAPECVGDFPRRPVRHADIAYLPRRHEVVGCTQRFIDWLHTVVGMNLVEIDTISAKARQTAFDRIHNMAAPRSVVVGPTAHRATHFGRDDDVAALDAQILD